MPPLRTARRHPQQVRSPLTLAYRSYSRSSGLSAAGLRRTVGRSLANDLIEVAQELRQTGVGVGGYPQDGLA